MQDRKGSAWDDLQLIMTHLRRRRYYEKTGLSFRRIEKQLGVGEGTIRDGKA
jgi:transposase